MSAPRVRLVVLNYNGGKHLRRCVDHLERLDWPADRLELVVIDNASSDGSERALEDRPRVHLIRSATNRGFPANNLGLRDLADVDYVGLVNNDAFVTPGYLHPLIDALASDSWIAAACPKILLASRFVDLRIASSTYRPQGDQRDLGVRISGARVGGDDRWRRVLFAQGAYPRETGSTAEPEFRWLAGETLVRVPLAQGETPTSVELRLAADRRVTVELDGGAGVGSSEVGPAPAWARVPLAGPTYDVINNVGSDLVNASWAGDRGFLEPDTGQYDEPQDVFAWCGAGVLFRPAYLQDVGLFDERFFMYYEDTDLAWRGRARGWRYRYVPAAELRHIHAATSVEGSPLFHHFVERNRLVMLTKNAPPRLAAGAAARFVLSTASYARRDVARPLMHRRRPSTTLLRARVRSFAAYLRMLPTVLRARHRLRSAQLVPDEAITGWSVPR